MDTVRVRGIDKKRLPYGKISSLDFPLVLYVVR